MYHILQGYFIRQNIVQIFKIMESSPVRVIAFQESRRVVNYRLE
jgi:hypothetical protein